MRGWPLEPNHVHEWLVDNKPLIDVFQHKLTLLKVPRAAYLIRLRQIGPISTSVDRRVQGDVRAASSLSLCPTQNIRIRCTARMTKGNKPFTNRQASRQTLESIVDTILPRLDT